MKVLIALIVGIAAGLLAQYLVFGRIAQASVTSYLLGRTFGQQEWIEYAVGMAVTIVVAVAVAEALG